MEGAKAALPIWAEFMKRAHKHRAYRDVGYFDVPDGVVSAQVDADTGGLATSACPKTVSEYYLVGTQPTQFRALHQGGGTEVASWEDTPAPQPVTPSTVLAQSGTATQPANQLTQDLP